MRMTMEEIKARYKLTYRQQWDMSFACFYHYRQVPYWLKLNVVKYG